jgi:hypothetical protein
MVRKILNFAMLDVCWLACVLGGARGMPGAAVAAASAVVGVHLGWPGVNRAGELRLLLSVTLVGFCMDSANLWMGVFSLIDAPRFPYLCPLWLAALWAAFGTSLRTSLSWLAGRYVLAALLGAVAGPLSYLGGAKLGAVTMHPNRAFSIAALAVGWAVMMPLLVWLAHGREKRCGSA